MKKIVLISTGLLIATSAAALAHTPSRASIDDREQRQLGRIEQGRQTGSITWTEGLKLRAEQRRIAQTEAALAADGRLTKSDRRLVNDLQNDANHSIHAESNDRRQRLWWLPRFGR